MRPGKGNVGKDWYLYFLALISDFTDIKFRNNSKIFACNYSQHGPVVGNR